MTTEAHGRPALSLLEQTLARIPRATPEVARDTRLRWDQKTKPPGSLGRLEELACRIAAITQRPDPPLHENAIVIMCADHGVARRGVSAYPQAVTAQMVRNFSRGGAAICVLARRRGARLIVVDMGVNGAPVDDPAVRVHRIGPGTACFTEGPAMSRAQARQAIEVGIALAHELAGDRIGAIGIGEMGIGNTTAASALLAAFSGAPVAHVTGRGTGIDDAGLARKRAVIEQALRVNAPDCADPIDVLSKLGGFEICGLAGLVLGAAENRVPIVLDGFIASVAALAAARIAPAAAHCLLASHCSAEPGHRLVLRALDQEPLLELGLRLGEATGAALALDLIDSALALLHEMATFEQAEVSRST